MRTFQLRRDILENWNTFDPVIADGMPIYVRDNGRLKIGDGIKKFSELEYFGHASDVLIALSQLTAVPNKLVFFDSSSNISSTSVSAVALELLAIDNIEEILQNLNGVPAAQFNSLAQSHNELAETAVVENDLGVGPNDIVQLNDDGKLPAVDGSKLKNIITAGQPKFKQLCKVVNKSSHQDGFVFAQFDNVECKVGDILNFPIVYLTNLKEHGASAVGSYYDFRLNLYQDDVEIFRFARYYGALIGPNLISLTVKNNFPPYYDLGIKVLEAGTFTFAIKLDVVTPSDYPSDPDGTFTVNMDGFAELLEGVGTVIT